MNVVLHLSGRDHGGVTLHITGTAEGFDYKPVLYAVCACGRGYAFGQQATVDELNAWISNHDWNRPKPEAITLTKRTPAGATAYLADVLETALAAPADEQKLRAAIGAAVVSLRMFADELEASEAAL